MTIHVGEMAIEKLQRERTLTAVVVVAVEAGTDGEKEIAAVDSKSAVKDLKNVARILKDAAAIGTVLKEEEIGTEIGTGIETERKKEKAVWTGGLTKEAKLIVGLLIGGIETVVLVYDETEIEKAALLKGEAEKVVFEKEALADVIEMKGLSGGGIVTEKVLIEKENRTAANADGERNHV